MSHHRDQQAMSPAARAEWDFRFGSNENPYPKDSSEWQQYEQHFDTLTMEEERLTDQHEAAIAEQMGNAIDGEEIKRGER